MGEADTTILKPSPRWVPLVTIAGLIVLALVLFRTLLAPDRVLVSTDANVGHNAYLRSHLAEWWSVGCWIDNTLTGFPGMLPLNLTGLLRWVFPPAFFTNWSYAFYIVLSSFFFWLYLRERDASPVPALVGALSAFWIGTNFTILDSGHVGKFGVMAFGMACLWLAEKAARSGRLAWAILAGGAMGCMFASQADVGLLFALFLGAYAVYAVLRDHGLRWAVLFRVLIPIPCVALLLAFASLWQGYRINVQGVKVMEDPKEKWEFVTQWSWVPGESIDFVAPGYFGWRSGDPEGPYWGKIGRSATWDQDQTGFPNFKLDNHYIGALPVGLAVWILILAFRHFPGRRMRTRDVLFWGLAALAAFALGSGKYSPVYRVFYTLPIVSSVRAPAKFLQIFQIAIGILAAFGLDALFSREEEGPWFSRKARLAAVVVAAAVTSVMALWWLSALGSSASSAVELSGQGWGNLATLIVANKTRALGHAVAMLGVLTAALAVTRPRAGGHVPRWARFVPWVCLAAVVLDMLLIAPRYMKTMPMGPIRDNAVVRFLQQSLGRQRASLVSRGGFYANWLTFVMPYHGIRTLEAPSMPRMSADYNAFLAKIGRDPVRTWQLTGVSHILAPGAVWNQLRQQPGGTNVVEIAYGYSVTADASSPVAVAIPPDGPNPEVSDLVLRLKVPSARFALIDSWELAAAEDALERIAAPDFQPYRQVVLSGAPESLAAADGGKGPLPGIEGRHSSPARHTLRVVTEEPAVLRFAESYHPDWEVRVDGEPAALMRCDFLFQGVYLPAGVHTVEFRFRPGTLGIKLQAVGYALCLAAILGLAVPAVRGRKKSAAEDETSTPGDDHDATPDQA